MKLAKKFNGILKTDKGKKCKGGLRISEAYIIY
jgi:hypothetical protein